MKQNYLLLLVVITLLANQFAYAQVGELKGTVVDKNNQPIANATVAQKGSTGATATSADGAFTLTTNPRYSNVLEVSAVGYVKKEVSFTPGSVLSVVLEEDVQNLSEVVTIGYQKISRKKATAAISSISAKEISNLPSSSFDQMLQGRLSGVNVQNFSGAPGEAPTVSVRGNSLVNRDYDQYNVINGPLYVIDDVPQPTETYATPGTGTGTNFLAGLNPADIESIDVLKDASASAIYGSRAANGVILITTKKGSTGKPRLTLTSYYGLTERPRLRDVTLGRAERNQKMDILQKQLKYTDQRQLPFLLTDSLNPAYNGNTDWQSLFYQTGKISDVNLSLSGGGNDGMTYRFSGEYYNEDGIIKATGFKRYSTRLNLNSWLLNHKLLINPIFGYSRTERARGNGDQGSPLGMGSGDMPSSLFTIDSLRKDLLLGSYNKNLDQNSGNQFNVDLNIKLNILKNLIFSSQSSYKYILDRRDYSRPSALAGNQGNVSYSYTGYNTSVRTSNYLNWMNEYKRHNINLVAGQDVEYNLLKNSRDSAWNGPSDNITVVSGFLKDKMRSATGYQAYGLLSYYARAAYDFSGKYMLSLSARYDGSSRFGANNKWGFFPAASAAWIVTEENFFKHKQKSLLTLWKIRGSYGITGDLPRDNYLQYNLYNVNAGYFNGSDANTYNGVTAIRPNFYNGVAQKNLSWEKSAEFNVGTDIELMNGKYMFTFDAFNKEKSLQLFSVELPVTSGYDYALTNSVGVRNRGFDFTAAAYPVKKAITWFTRLNFSYVKGKITTLPNGGRDLIMSGDRFDKSHILSIGSPINAFYLYRNLGVFKDDAAVPVNPYTGERFRNGNGAYQAGDFWFADLDGDYFIDIFNDGINPDKLPTGDPNPHFTGGWTNNISYKNFTLSMLFNYVFKRDVLNLFESDRFANSQDGDPVNRFVYYSTPDMDKVNIWKQPGDVAEYAKFDLGTYRYYYTSAQTFFLEKGDFVRFKSLMLMYNVPYTRLKRFGISTLKLNATVDNFVIWQKSRKLPDAEAVNSYGEYNGRGYPIPKKYTIGLELTF